MYEKGKQNRLVKILARGDEGLAKNYVKGCANNDLVIPLTDATGLKKHARKLYLIIILLQNHFPLIINIDLL